jgi:hypothetical protein
MFGAVLVLAAAAYGAQAAAPKLRIVAPQPLVVVGSGFTPGERVTVSALTSLGPRVRRTRATTRGTFKVSFRPFPQPCGKPFAVRARGAESGVALARLPAPPCIPPPR